MDLQDLLAKLTPGEFYTWAWLCALRILPDGTLDIAGLRPPNYSKWQLNRILRTLESKKLLTFITRPKNQSGPRIIALSKTARRCIFAPAPEHQCTSEAGFDHFEGLAGASMHQHAKPRNADQERSQDSRRSIGAPANPKLSLALLRKEKALKAYTTMSQKELVNKIRSLEPGECEELLMILAKTSFLAKKRKLSKKAIVYAAIRYLQEAESIQTPRAWVETVAQRFDRVGTVPLSSASVPLGSRSRTG